MDLWEVHRCAGLVSRDDFRRDGLDDFGRHTKACESLCEGIGKAFEALEEFRFIDHLRVIAGFMIVTG